MMLSIITVTWNSEEHIEALIRSVQDACGDTISFEHIIVDNASTDTTVKKIKQYPAISLIEHNTNKGFAAANNVGLAKATGEYILFLNPDMCMLKDSMPPLLSWFKQAGNVGIASVKLVTEQGTIHPDCIPRRFPTLIDQLAILCKIPHFLPSILNTYLMKNFDADAEQSVDSVRGSFMLTKKETLTRVGFAFDPRYFIWFEDVDLCKEIHRLGMNVVYTPIISCIDYVGSSFKKQDVYSKQKQLSRSMIMYFKKWGHWYEWCIISIVRVPVLMCVWIYTKVVQI